jgi:hypothetical protein
MLQGGREELFEQERHKEPVAGWHYIDLPVDHPLAPQARAVGIGAPLPHELCTMNLPPVILGMRSLKRGL